MKVVKNIPEGITFTLDFEDGASVTLNEKQFSHLEQYFYNKAKQAREMLSRPVTVTSDPFWEYFYKQDPLNPFKVT